MQPKLPDAQITGEQSDNVVIWLILSNHDVPDRQIPTELRPKNRAFSERCPVVAMLVPNSRPSFGLKLSHETGEGQAEVFSFARRMIENQS